MAVEPTGSGGRGPRALPQEEPLDAILSPELDKMVTDGQWTLFSVCGCVRYLLMTDLVLVLLPGAILSKLYKIPGITFTPSLTCSVTSLFNFFVIYTIYLCVCLCAELEGKDVEEVFTAVLSPSSSNNTTLKQIQHTHHLPAGKTNTVNTGTGFDTATGL